MKIPWNKGIKLSKEHIEKLKKSHIGKKHTKEQTEKIRNALLGRIPWNKGVKGIHQSKNTEFKKGQLLGDKSYTWKGGISSINIKIRGSVEYKLWRDSVYKRDNWTCIWCGQVGGKLNADHIKPFSLYPELRFAIDNGRTLCINCHKKTGTWGKH